MKRHRTPLVLVSLSLFVCIATTPVSKASQGPSDKERAVALLVAVAEEGHGLQVRSLKPGPGYSGGFQDMALRVHVQADAADVLWPHDATRARAIFERAFADTAALAPPDSDRGSYGPDQRLELRGAILQIARRHDSALVSALQKTIVAASPGQAALVVDPKDWSFESKERILELAAFLSRVDPPAAAAILAKHGPRGSLDNRLWSDAVSEIRLADPTRARELILQAINESAGPERHCLTLESIRRLVFPKQVLRVASIWEVRDGAPDPVPPVDPKLARLYLEAFHRASQITIASFEAKLDELRAQAPSPRRSREMSMLLEDLGFVFSYVTSLDEEFELYDPERLLDQCSLGGRIENFVARILDVLRVNELRDESLVAFSLAQQHGTLSERVRRMTALVPKLPFEAEKKRSIYADISRFAMLNGDFATAKTYAEKSGRKYPANLNLARTLSARAAARAGKFDVAVCELDEIDDPETRVQANLVVGSDLAARGEREQALLFLNRVTIAAPSSNFGILDFDAESAAYLARALALVDVERGFVALEKAIHLENLENRNRVVLWPARTGLEGAFEALARADFARSDTLALKIRERRLAMVCQLVVARSALGSR